MADPCMDFDVAKQPSNPGCVCAPGVCTCGPSCNCVCCYGNGPGGNSMLSGQNNEKGILETGLFQVIAKHQQAAMGSQHDPLRQGIYATNSVGDND
jgi:hypothetical protein